MIGKTAIAWLLAGAAGLAWAQATPVGLWKTIDDKTNAEKSFVRIAEAAGVLSGKVEKIVNPEKQGEVCKECTDDRKDKPILGMTIIRNAKKADDGTWEGGEILNPEEGKVYRLRLRPLDAGKRLEVRGYFGPFFKTQYWIRAE
jgi:uncharacterized protein (DUF2147 family)